MGEQALRVGIIGCGRISDRHLQVLRELAGFRVVAVCDVVRARREKAAATAAAKPYESFDEMVRTEKLDVVSVLTESGSHAPIGVAVAPYTQSLVVEKPMALRLEEADGLIEACDRSHTRLFVVKQNRFNPAVVRLRRALEAGRFGKLVLGTVRVRWCRKQDYYDQASWRGTWRDDGGVFTNQASHHLDLLQWMMGPIEAVQAYTTTALARIETEDTGVAVVRFVNGALGVIEATTATRPKDLEGSLSVLGENGAVVIGGFAVNRVDTWQFADHEPGDDDVLASSVIPPNVYGYGHRAFYENVSGAIRNAGRGLIDGLEGRKALELINAIYEAAGSRSEVRLRYVPRGVPLGRPGP